jgi:hypothetical protein
MLSLKKISLPLTLSLMAATAQADVVVLDDHVVTGSQCVGLDCVNGENFSFDTIKVKENNTRILFDDTSSSASFPKTDWRLIANDSANGGRNHFTIEDATAGHEVFTLMGAAPANSLFISATGNLGLGTDEPAQSLHISSANGPTIRLEQNQEGGFDAANWDIRVDETGLQISMGGSNKLTIDVDGNVTIPGDLTAGTPADTFPDYVFAPGYSLMPLTDLQTFVRNERHLPGVPTAAQVGAEGLNMTQFQVLLLQKLEELTLYTLQQQTEIEALRAAAGNNP